MDIDTRSKYLRLAKGCADGAERTTDPKVREILLKVPRCYLNAPTPLSK